MTKIICDLCGEVINNLDSKSEFKVKRKFYAFDWCGWERIDVHNECIKKFYTAIKAEQRLE